MRFDGGLEGPRRAQWSGKRIFDAMAGFGLSVADVLLGSHVEKGKRSEDESADASFCGQHSLAL